MKTSTFLTCTRRIEFDAAHRVCGHEGKCKHLHGHRYALEVSVAADDLDTLGRVVDFGVIKERLGAWVDAHWDHTTILHAADRELGEKITSVTGQEVFYLPQNPTAENMAAYVFDVVFPTLFAGLPLRCTRLKLYETPNCFVEVSGV